MRNGCRTKEGSDIPATDEVIILISVHIFSLFVGKTPKRETLVPSQEGKSSS